MTKYRLASAIAVPFALCLAVQAEPAEPAAQDAPSTRPTTAPAALVEGKVTQVDDRWGNAYTSIKADQYDALGLVAGEKVILAWGESSTLEISLGEDYFSVAKGEPVAVLHENGLTFAIRDGNFSEVHEIAVGEAFKLLPINE